jgi:hypothetical protein
VKLVIFRTCSPLFGCRLQATYLGPGDIHDNAFDEKEYVVAFYDESDKVNSHSGYVNGSCLSSFHVYPTTEFRREYESKLPVVVTVTVAGVFLLMLVVLAIYDMVDSRRSRKMLNEGKLMLLCDFP